MPVVYQISTEARYPRRIVQAAASVELDEAIRLQVYGFAVVGGEELEGLVQAAGVALEGQRKLRQVMHVNLGLVCAGGHDLGRVRKTEIHQKRHTHSPSSLQRTT